MLALYRGAARPTRWPPTAHARRALLDGLGPRARAGAARPRAADPAPRRSGADRPPRPPDEARTAPGHVPVRPADRTRREPTVADPERLQRSRARYHALVGTSCQRHGGARSSCEPMARWRRSGCRSPTKTTPCGHCARGGGARRRSDPGRWRWRRRSGISTGVVVAPRRCRAALFGEPVTVSEGLARSRARDPNAGIHAHAGRARGAADRPRRGSYRLDATIDDVPSIGRRLDRPLVGRTRQIERAAGLLRAGPAPGPAWS